MSTMTVLPAAARMPGMLTCGADCAHCAEPAQLNCASQTARAFGDPTKEKRPMAVDVETAGTATVVSALWPCPSCGGHNQTSYTRPF